MTWSWAVFVVGWVAGAATFGFGMLFGDVFRKRNPIVPCAICGKPVDASLGIAAGYAVIPFSPKKLLECGHTLGEHRAAAYEAERARRLAS